MPKGINTDKLYSLSRDKVARETHNVLSYINRLQGEDMVAAVSVLFAAVTNRCGLDPAAMHHFGTRILRHEDFHAQANLQLEALRDFAGIQVAGDKNVSIM